MNSRIILCKGIKLDRDYVNVLSYSESKLLDMCRNTKYRISEKSDYSFISKDNVIRTDFTYEQCLKANYIAFQNPSYDNKWFFAFIDSIRYLADNVTEISFTVDAWSTWFSDWDKKPCFIVREHVNNDNIGANTVPEDVIPNMVESVKVQSDSSLDNTYGYYIAVASNYEPSENTQFPCVSLYNGMIFAEKLFLFDGTTTSGITGAVQNLGLFLLSQKGHLEDIKNVFIVPNACIDESKLESKTLDTSSGQCKYYELRYDISPKQYEMTISRSNLNVKNNKCYCYPYHYLLVTNNNGYNKIYNFEQFKNPSSVKFVTQIAISPRLFRKNHTSRL